MNQDLDELDIEGELGALGPFHPADTENIQSPQQIISQVGPTASDYASSRLQQPLQPIYNQVMDSGPSVGESVGNSGGGSFDWQRALAAFGGGPQAASALDQNRLAKRKYDEESPLRQTDLQDRLNDRKSKRKAMYDSLDPQSDTSKSAASDFDSFLSGAAEDLQEQFPSVSKSLLSQVGSANGKSAAQIQRTQSQLEARLGRIMKLSETNYKRQSSEDERKWKRNEADENQDLRRMGIESSNANASAMRRLANARFTEQRDERQRSRDEKEAESYGKDIAPLNEALATLEEAQDLKKNTNTGVVSSFVNEIRKKLGVPDSNMVKLEAAQGTLNAVVRKLQAGTALSPAERQLLRETTPDVNMDDLEYELKQQRMKSTLDKKIGQMKAKHPMTTSVKNTASTDNGKSDRARAAIASSNATPEQKRNAQAYLDSLK